jgi:hypothetical protein
MLEYSMYLNDEIIVSPKTNLNECKSSGDSPGDETVPNASLDLNDSNHKESTVPTTDTDIIKKSILDKILSVLNHGTFDEVYFSFKSI